MLQFKTLMERLIQWKALWFNFLKNEQSDPAILIFSDLGNWVMAILSQIKSKLQKNEGPEQL